MKLAEQVHIARRFQRSIRIDQDSRDLEPLKGYICPKSSVDILVSMAHQINETGQGAFTWTGPYGSGKSSLVVALNALLKGQESLRKDAAKMIEITGPAEEIWKKLPPQSKGWHVIPVV